MLAAATASNPNDVIATAAQAANVPAPVAVAPVAAKVEVADDDANASGASATDDGGAADEAGTEVAVDLSAAGLAGPAAPQLVTTSATGAAASAPLSATAADLVAQMAARVGAGASAFQLQLNPAGLGRVDVQVSIDADRRLTAKLSFDSANAATALHAHSAELQGALERLGFTVASDGVSFSTAAQSQTATTFAGGGFDLGAGSSGGQGAGSGGSRASQASSAFSQVESAGLSAASGGLSSSGQLDIRI